MLSTQGLISSGGTGGAVGRVKNILETNNIMGASQSSYSFSPIHLDQTPRSEYNL